MEKKILHSVINGYGVDGITNEITEFLNSILNDEHKRMLVKYNQGHYFIPNRRESGWGFRYPGATRGCIEIDKDNIITGIKFTGGPASVFDIYDETRKDEFNKFIGWEVDYPYRKPSGGKENE